MSAVVHQKEEGLTLLLDSNLRVTVVLRTPVLCDNTQLTPGEKG